MDFYKLYIEGKYTKFNTKSFAINRPKLLILKSICISDDLFLIIVTSSSRIFLFVINNVLQFNELYISSEFQPGLGIHSVNVLTELQLC